MAKASTLQLTDWSTQSVFTLPGYDTTIVDGNLVIAATPNYPVTASNTTYDLTESQYEVELISAPNRDNGSVTSNMIVRADAANYFTYGYDDSYLGIAYIVGGAAATYHGYITYDPAVHKNLRVRETGGTLYFEAGSGETWATVYTRPVDFALTNVSLQLRAGNWNSAPNPGSAVWGDVNPSVAPPPPPPTTGLAPAVTRLKQANGTWRDCMIRLLPYTAVIPQGFTELSIEVNPSVRTYAANGIAWDATTKTIARPQQIVAGDLLIAMVMADSGTMPTNVAPSGWTEIGRRISTTVRFVLLRKVATSTDAAGTGPFTLAGFPASADGCAMCIAVKDWSGTAGDIRSAFTATTNQTYVAPTVTPATARSLLLTFVSQNGNSGSKLWSYIPPAGSGAVGYTENVGGWNGGAASQEVYAGTTATGTRTWTVDTNSTAAHKMNASVTIPAGTATKTATQMLAEYTATGGTGGPLTDTYNNTFEDSTGLTSRYHLFADGLDWSKKVGLLVYTDGSGEWGLDTPNLADPYLLAGANGMIATAKKHNMVLLTPRAPGDGCNDGDGVCWYDHSQNGVSPWQKLEWSNELIRWVLTRYNIDRTRIAIGGYSSGAQWTMSWFGPRYASEIMLDGVAVAISYGGPPRVRPAITAAYKAAVEHVWDVGTADDSYVQTRWWDGVVGGRTWYQQNGFTTTDLITRSGGHDRSDFGVVMDTAITARVPPA